MSRLSRTLTLVAATAAISCGPPPPAAPVPEGTFAPELNVEMSAMERTDTGLYVQTLREGSGVVAEAGDRVVVHYEGWLPDGTRFESSREREEALEVLIGRGVVIDGWDQGIVGMRVGELRRLVVPPELGYGAQGSPGVVPPDTPLLFHIQLLGVR